MNRLLVTCSVSKTFAMSNVPARFPLYQITCVEHQFSTKPFLFGKKKTLPFLIQGERHQTLRLFFSKVLTRRLPSGCLSRWCTFQQKHIPGGTLFSWKRDKGRHLIELLRRPRGSSKQPLIIKISCTFILAECWCT